MRTCAGSTPMSRFSCRISTPRAPAARLRVKCRPPPQLDQPPPLTACVLDSLPPPCSARATLVAAAPRRGVPAAGARAHGTPFFLIKLLTPCQSGPVSGTALVPVAVAVAVPVGVHGASLTESKALSVGPRDAIVARSRSVYTLCLGIRSPTRADRARSNQAREPERRGATPCGAAGAGWLTGPLTAPRRRGNCAFTLAWMCVSGCTCYLEEPRITPRSRRSLSSARSCFQSAGGGG